MRAAGVVLGEHRGARFRWSASTPVAGVVGRQRCGRPPRLARARAHLVGVGLAGIGYARKAAGHFQHGAEVRRRVHGELPAADALGGFLHGAGCHRRLAGGQDAQQRGAVRARIWDKLVGALVGRAGGVGRIIGAHRVLDDGHAIGSGGRKLRASLHVGQNISEESSSAGSSLTAQVSRVGSKLKLNADKSGVLTGAPF